MVLPLGATTCTPKSLKRAIVGPHKQKPRLHMLEGRGFLGIERAAWGSAQLASGGKATYPLTKPTPSRSSCSEEPCPLDLSN